VTPRRPGRWSAAALALLPAACATPLVEDHVATAHVQQRWAPAIVAGETPVAALERAFGPPTATFEQGRLRGWVLMLVEKGLVVAVDDEGRVRTEPPVRRDSGAARSARRAAIDADGELRTVAAADLAERALWPTWREGEYHLIASVDAAGRVARWSFRRVLP